MLKSFARWKSLRNGIVFAYLIVVFHLAPVVLCHSTSPMEPVDLIALKADDRVIDKGTHGRWDDERVSGEDAGRDGRSGGIGTGKVDKKTAVPVTASTQSAAERSQRPALGGGIVEGTFVPPPSSLRLLFINVSAVQIFWDYPKGDDPLPIMFLVQVSHDGQPYQNVSGMICAAVFIYNRMLFGAYYQFQVLAVFEGVVSAPAVSDYFINGVTAPPGPPAGIQAVIVSPWKLSLSWEVPATPTPPVYIIVWGEDPNNLDRMMQVYQTTHAEIQNLTPESHLYFRVRADISGRWSILSDWVNITMPPPYVMALIITNHTLSSTWVWLEWQLSPDQLFFNYQVSVFSVCYGNDSSSSSSKANMTGHSGSAPSVNSTCPPALEPPCWCRRYPPSASSANVTNLTSNTTYYFFLKYLTTLLDLSSLWSQQLAITTLQDPTLLCLACKPLSDTQLLLDWTVVGARFIRSLRVESCAMTVSHNWTSFSKVFRPPLPSSAGSITVTHLHPWTSYSMAIISDDLSPPDHRASCPVGSCSTLEGVPTAPPSEVNAWNVTSQVVTLAVTPPPSEQLNGRLSGYVVKVACLDGDKEEASDESAGTMKAWQETGRKTSLCMDQEMFLYRNWTTLGLFVVEVKGLLPSQFYSLQVAAATSAGVGPYSSNKTVQMKREVYEVFGQLELKAINDGRSSSMNFFNTSSNCVQSVLHLQWMPAFSYEEDEGSELHHVNFHKYRISSLDVQLCLTSSRTWTSCTFLDGKNFITQLTLNFSLSELPDSVVSKLFPINWDGILWASLDLEVELVNGSVLHVTSPRVQIRVQLICPSNTGQKRTVSISTTVLASLLPLAFVLGVVIAISTSALCIYKEWKRRRTRSFSEMAMENYSSPQAIWNSYVPMRAGDGRSSNSSSEQSLVTVSTGVTSDGTSTVTAEPENGNESDASLVSLVDLTVPQSNDGHNTAACDIHGGLGCRSSPDGHSLSSDSGESRNCLVDI